MNYDGTGFLSNIDKVAAGYSHVLALDTAEDVWAWGSNQYGQLGDDTTIDKYLPIKITALSGIQNIGAGDSVSIAVEEKIVEEETIYKAKVWGNNERGQLGLGSNYNTFLVPTPLH